MDIRNLYCAGRNYALHAKELGNDVPKEPIVFLKPTHAAAPMDGRQIMLDGSRGAIHYEAEIVVRIGRAFDPEADPDSLISGFAMGMDFTLRDEQKQAQEAGLPWLSAKGFRNAALLTAWMPYPGTAQAADTRFALQLNGREVQSGSASQMIFTIPELVRYIGTRFGLAEGDVIFTGTPAGVGPVEDGDVLECFWDGASTGSCTIRIE